MTNRNLGITHDTIKTPAIKLIQSARRSPIPGVCMTCMEMSGNGVRIGSMITIMVLLLMAVHGKVEAALSGFYGAAAGTTSPGLAGLRPATGTIPMPSSEAWVFEW
jgi:hypothetical protein